MSGGPDAWAIIVAAGASRRMEGRDKTLAPLAGRPLLYYSLRLREDCAAVEGVVVVAAAAARRAVEQLAASAGCRKVRAVVAGGPRRQDSAAAGVAAARALAPAAARVLVHDAARPLASPALVARVLAALADADGAVPGVAPADTIKEVDATARVAATLCRDRLRAVQTPQGFGLAALAVAYERAQAEGWEVTDDAAALERAGGNVVVVEGEVATFKITYPADLARAELLLQSR
jgi:2-C-methyl-D-erythritol 4-phosphate cytidylyltransferase/2-C-methyl-D-erythritol 2,4-cyclodiphosphate synthase